MTRKLIIRRKGKVWYGYATFKCITNKKMLNEFIRNVGETIIRLVLALVFGGVLGYERGQKQRPAGLRTYMLVCVGSALVMMTNEYIHITFGAGDLGRMGAQVISGIGFLGAGTILVTKHNRVIGLTTAAGLWSVACIGLAIGIGYYSGAILGFIMIFLAMTALHRVDNRALSSTKVMNIYIVFDKINNMNEFIKYVKKCKIKISGLEWSKSNSMTADGIAALITLNLPRKQEHDLIIFDLKNMEGVKFLEEV